MDSARTAEQAEQQSTATTRRWPVASLARLAVVGLLLVACTAPAPVVPPPLPSVLFVWPTFPDPPSTPLPVPAVDGFQAVLNHAVETNDMLPESRAGAAGITAAVVTDRGIWTGAAGVDGRGVPLVPTSRSKIAGITNTAVAAEVLRLADARRMDLDAPLSTYVAHGLGGNPATVRQFLGLQATYSELSFQLLDRAIERVNGHPVRDDPADALAVARWGYDLYGSRIVPPDDVVAMTTPAGPDQVAEGYRYGLGTMLFSRTLGLGDAFGHTGHAPGAQSILAVVPGRHIAVAILIFDDDKAVIGPVQDLFGVLNTRLDR
jgi:CubicO group peptidase (beta-lactamase class C family)